MMNEATASASILREDEDETVTRVEEGPDMPMDMDIPLNISISVPTTTSNNKAEETEDDAVQDVLMKRAMLEQVEEQFQSDYVPSSSRVHVAVAGTSKCAPSIAKQQEEAEAPLSLSVDLGVEKKKASAAPTTTASTIASSGAPNPRTSLQPQVQPGAYRHCNNGSGAVERVDNVNVSSLLLAAGSRATSASAASSIGSRDSLVDHEREVDTRTDTRTSGDFPADVPSNLNRPDLDPEQPPQLDGEGLAKAQLVMEDDSETNKDVVLQAANPVDLSLQQQQQQEQKKHQQYLFRLGVAILVIVAGGIVGIVVAVATQNPEVAMVDHQEEAAAADTLVTDVPSQAPTSVMNLFLDTLPNQTQENIVIYGTPQNQAWDWLVLHPNQTNLPEWRKTQLFALATFFYAFQGPNWNPLIRERWISYELEECYWFSSGVGDFVDGQYWTLTEIYAEAANYHPFSFDPCTQDGKFARLFLGDLELTEDLELEPQIPPEIALLTSLVEVSFDASNINTTVLDLFPTELYQMTHLRDVLIAGNTLRGGLPTELGLFSQLNELYLYENSLTGVIPSEIGLLTNMVHLWLGDNLRGVGRANDLGANHLQGTVPSEVGLLRDLQTLHLARNELTGWIPTELGECRNMTDVWLSGNAFTGQFPSEMGQMTMLGSLRFQDSLLLSGSLPTEVGLMTALTSLIMGDSPHLGGPIPTEIGLLTNLQRLELPNNQEMTGSIPTEFGQLSSLVALQLPNMPLLTGSVPSELSGLSLLGLVNITGSTGLTGTLPESICYFQNASCRYQLNWWESLRNCSLDFSCTESLCGCDCDCPLN